MDLLDELLRNTTDPALIEQVRALMAQVESKNAELSQVNAEIARKNAEMVRKDQKIDALTHELAYYRRVRFTKKSEAFTGEQRDLFEETWDTDIGAIDADVEQITTGKRTRISRHAGRKPLPPELPRIEHRHEPESCTCGKCGQDLVKIGEDVTEQLDVEPARFFVRRHIDRKSVV